MPRSNVRRTGIYSQFKRGDCARYRMNPVLIFMLNAIITKYKGVEFRSRLEARWAVFFETLKIHWEYEAEGFELEDGTWYLPDFRCVNHKDGRKCSWYEVKPLNTFDLTKFDKFKHEIVHNKALGGETKNNLVSLIGSPNDFFYSTQRPTVCPNCGAIKKGYRADQAWHANVMSEAIACTFCAEESFHKNEDLFFLKNGIVCNYYLKGKTIFMDYLQQQTFSFLIKEAISESVSYKF